MTEKGRIAQQDLLCSNCAGQCAYQPASGALGCMSCGAEHTIVLDPNADPGIEHHYHPDLPHTEQPVIETDRQFQCETCGGSVVFHGHSISENCPYCDGALVAQEQDESYAILGMIPFSVSEKEAQLHAQAWAKGRWAAPDDLTDVIATSRVAGLYVPFWTFDSHEAVAYSLRYRVQRGKRTAIRSMRGKMNTRFDDLLMPASPHVTPLIRDGILHEFDPQQLRPFMPAYLAGFAAERHHQSVRRGLAKNAPDKALLLRNRIKAHSGKDRILDVSYKTDTTGIKYRRILLPVWILHYEYQGKKLKIASCGLRGRTFGERPFSTPKLVAFAAIAASAAAAFGFLWGASGLY